VKDEYKVTQFPTDDYRYTTVEDATTAINDWADKLKDKLTDSSVAECIVTGAIRHSDDTIDVVHIAVATTDPTGTLDLTVCQRAYTWQHRVHESSREVFDELYAQLAPTFVEHEVGGTVSIGNSEDINLVYKADDLDKSFYNEPDTDEPDDSDPNCDCN
jgi:hypothetical protein